MTIVTLTDGQRGIPKTNQYCFFSNMDAFGWVAAHVSYSTHPSYDEF
jgi:hypothetical protein